MSILRISYLILTTLLGVFFCNLSSAATIASITHYALTHNPELRAASEQLIIEHDNSLEAKSQFFPQLDLAASAGEQESQNVNTQFNKIRTSPTDISLKMDQLIFDFGATHSEVLHYNAKYQSAYFKLKSLAQHIALSIIVTCIEMQRYRKLLQLAKKNYNQHYNLLKKLKSRHKNGFSHNAEVLEAASSVSLAKANINILRQDIKNTQSVFQRYVGLPAPRKNLYLRTPYRSMMPQSFHALIHGIIRHSNHLKSATADIHVSQRERSIAHALFYPRLDVVAETDLGHNINGTFGNTQSSVVKLQLSYHLFKGGYDIAAIKKETAKVNQAYFARDNAYREAIQKAHILWNSYRTNQKLVKNYRTHKTQTALAAKYYYKQFKVGNQSLLDLLSIENKKFQANQVYYNCYYDLLIDKYKLLYSSNKLLHFIYKHAAK